MKVFSSFFLIKRKRKIKADIKGPTHMAGAPPPMSARPTRPTRSSVGVPGFLIEGPHFGRGPRVLPGGDLAIPGFSSMLAAIHCAVFAATWNIIPIIMEG